MYISDGSGSGAWTDTGATIGSASFSTGDLKPTFKTTADSGWIMADDGTIGDLSSGASNLASSTTQNLFYLLWNNCANTEAAVSSGRGVSAVADYAAHKTIALPKMLGRVYGVAGAGSGLTSRVLGKTVGVETYALDTTELPAHTHFGTTGSESATHTHAYNASHQIGTTIGSGGFAQIAQDSTTNTNINNTTHTHDYTTSSVGSNVAHQNMQPTVFLNIMVKL